MTIIYCSLLHFKCFKKSLTENLILYCILIVYIFNILVHDKALVSWTKDSQSNYSEGGIYSALLKKC